MMDRNYDRELSDEELEELGVEIPETETDGGFFEDINKMIEEIFQGK